MPTIRLSPGFVRRVSCPSDLKKMDYFDTTMRGFMLEVRASGGKTYYQRYSDERGRERQFKIGAADVLTRGERRSRSRLRQFSAAIRRGNVKSEDQFRP